MSCQLKILVLLLSFWLILLPLYRVQAAPQKSNSQQPVPSTGARSKRPATVPEPETDQTTNLAYFTLRDGMDSTLTLQNLAPKPTPVTVTVFSSEGRPEVLDPITLDPHSFREIDLATAIKKPNFDSGNVQIAFHGRSMAVTCQVSVSDIVKRISFESRELDMMDFESSNLNGIVSLPQKGAKGFLAVTNVSKNQATVHVSIGSTTKDILVSPRETRLLKLNEEFGLYAPTAALLKLSQTGLPGDIISTGFVMDVENGYSSAFTMTDPKIMRSSHLAGAHFRFGQTDPGEGFPAGTTFNSPLLLANVSDAPVVAHISVDYTVTEKLAMTPVDAKQGSAEDKFSTVTVKDVTIAPGDVHRIELAQELAHLGVPAPVQEAGVDIDYQAPPGSLIGELVSVDQTGDYDFEVPIKDAAAMNAMMEGIYPWTLEDSTGTVLHLKNTTDKAVRALATLAFAGGDYNLPGIALQPYQTIAIDIQKLKDSKKPDARGQPFPANVTHGQVVWRQVTPYSIIGRAEQTDVSGGIARSFSCGGDCCANFLQEDCVSTSPCAPNSDPGYSINTSGLTGDADGSGTVYGYSYGWDCNAYRFGPVDSTPNYFASENTNVATVDSSGNVSYVAAGSTIIDGDFTDPYYSYNWQGFCYSDTPQDNLYSGYNGAPVTVCVPQSLYIMYEDALTYSGTDAVECGNSAGPPPVWGHSLCVHYQMIDSCGNYITTNNYLISEGLTVTQQSAEPGNQTFQPAMNVPVVNGTFGDFLEYASTAAPGVPSSEYADVYQLIMATDTNNGHVYNLKKSCIYYQSSGINLTDITAGGSCP
jgi:hypothetical protein